MDPRLFSLIDPEMFRRVEEHVRTFVRDRVGRNEPCPCGSGRKYKACCLPKDTGSEKYERLLSGAPFAPASTEYQFPGITEHVAYALRGEERVARLGERFDALDGDLEAVELAVGAAAAAKALPDRAAARVERAFPLRFDPCLDYLAMVRLAAPEPGSASEKLLRLAAAKAETYRPHPLTGGDFLAEARTHLAAALAAQGRVAEAAALIETLVTLERVSPKAAAGAATVALGLDRAPVAEALLAPQPAFDDDTRRVATMARSRTLPSGLRLVPELAGLWSRDQALPPAERSCPLCSARGLKACRLDVSEARGALWCPACRVALLTAVPPSSDDLWPDAPRDRQALADHLSVYPGTSRG